MRDKGGDLTLTLTLTLHPGRSCGNGPSTQGSVAELGHSGGKYQPHGGGEGAGTVSPLREFVNHPHGRGEGAVAGGGWSFDHSITPTGVGKERRSLILVVR